MTARFQHAALKRATVLYDRSALAKFKTRDRSLVANVMKGTLIHSIKVNTAQEQPRARYVAQGQRDKAKPCAVHNLAHLRQLSARFIASTLSNLDFRLIFYGFIHAFLQSRKPFTMKIHLDPRPAEREQIGVADGEVLLINLLLYGASDAGDSWGNTMTAHILDDLTISPLFLDPQLFVKSDTDSKLARGPSHSTHPL